MKIVYISSSIIPSRTANSIHVMKMCQALAQNGHNVILLAPDKKDQYEQTVDDVFTYYNVENTFVVKKLSWFLRMRGKTYFYALWSALKARTLRCDLVYSRNIFSAYFCAALGMPVAFESHAPMDRAGKSESWFFGRLIKSSRLKRMVVITHALKDYYIKNYPMLSSRILVAPDGADPVSDERLKDGSSRKNARVKVGYVGHLYAGKGMEIVLNLADRCPWADFHVVGGTEGDIVFWREEASSPNIIFHGYVPHSSVAEVMQEFDVVLLPNQNSVSAHGKGNLDIGKWTSPLKAFEYMAAKKPIIASDLAVLREILQHEKNALLCPAEDVQAWEAALTRLVQDKALADHIASAGHAGFMKEYTWKARAERVLEGLPK